MCLSKWMHSPELPRVATLRTMSMWPIPFPAETGSQLWRAAGRPDLTGRPLSDTGKKKPSPHSETTHKPLHPHPPLLPHPALAGDAVGNATDTHAARTEGTQGGMCSGRLFRAAGVSSLTCERPNNTEASRPREAANSWGQMGWQRGRDRCSAKRKPHDGSRDDREARAARPGVRLLSNLAAETQPRGKEGVKRERGTDLSVHPAGRLCGRRPASGCHHFQTLSPTGP